MIGGWCKYCKDHFSPYPAKKPDIAFEERRKAMVERARKERGNEPPETDMGLANELFGHIPPAPKVQAENDTFDF